MEYQKEITIVCSSHNHYGEAKTYNDLKCQVNSCKNEFLFLFLESKNTDWDKKTEKYSIRNGI